MAGHSNRSTRPAPRTVITEDTGVFRIVKTVIIEFQQNAVIEGMHDLATWRIGFFVEPSTPAIERAPAPTRNEMRVVSALHIENQTSVADAMQGGEHPCVVANRLDRDRALGGELHEE